MAESHKGTVDISIALKGLADVERGIAVMKSAFGDVAKATDQANYKFKSFSDALQKIFKGGLAGLFEGGFKGMIGNLKTSIGDFSHAFKGLLIGALVTLAGSILNTIKNVFIGGVKLYINQIYNQLKGAFDSIKALTGFDKFFSASGWIEGTQAISKYTKELQKESLQTGIAIKELAVYKVAMENAGVASEELGKRLAYMGKQLTKAFAGTAPDAERVLRNLNITQTQMFGKTSQEKFLIVAEAINKLSNNAEKAHASMLLFERAGHEMLPFMEDMEYLTKNANIALGSLPSTLEKNRKAFVLFENQLSYFEIKRQQFFSGVLLEFVSPVNDFLKKLNAIDFTPYGQNFAKNFLKSINSFSKGDIIGGLSNLIKELSSVFNKSFDRFIKAIDQIDFTPLSRVLIDVFKDAFNISLRGTGVFIKQTAKTSKELIGSFLAGPRLRPLMYPRPQESESERNLRLIKASDKRLTEREENYVSALEYDLKTLTNNYFERLGYEIEQKNKIIGQSLIQAQLNADKLAASSILTPEQENLNRYKRNLEEIELYGDQLANSIVKNSHVVRNAVDELFKFLSQEEIQNFNPFTFDIFDFERVDSIPNAIATKGLMNKIEGFSKVNIESTKEALESIAGFVPEGVYGEIEALFTKLQNLKVERIELFNKSQYFDLERALKKIDLSIDNLNFKSNLINSDENLSNHEKRLLLYANQNDLLKELTEKAATLKELTGKATGLGDIKRIEELQEQAQKIENQIQQLRNYRDPAQDVRIDRAYQSFGNFDSAAQTRIEQINGLIDLQFNKNRMLRGVYKEQLDARLDLIDTLKNEIAQIQAKGPLLEIEQDQINQLTLEIGKLQSEIKSLDGALNKTSIFDGVRDGFISFIDSIGSAYDIAKNITQSTATSISDSLGNALTGLIMQTKTVSQAFAEMGLQILNSIVSMIMGIVAQLVVAAAIIAPLNWMTGGIFGGMMKMFSFGMFAEGGRVSGGRQMIQVNEDGSEYVVSAKSPKSNDRWLELANQGVDLNKVLFSKGYTPPASQFPEGHGAGKTSGQTNVTVQTHSDLWNILKQSGIVKNITREQKRMGAFA
jgi:hypothetical protein